MSYSNNSKIVSELEYSSKYFSLQYLTKLLLLGYVANLLHQNLKMVLFFSNRYVLRAVVWNTEDVVLQETSVATGESMSDIYVKGFLQGRIQDAQKTDIHYR